MDATEIETRMRKIKLIILDVDGVLTDGHIVYGDYGDELKFYDITDGMGLQLLRNAGIPSVIVSGRKSKTNERRGKDLKIVRVYQGVGDKLKVFTKILKKFKVTPEEICCIGDDLADLPLMNRAGFAVAVQNAVAEVKSASHYVTARGGGRGAVREIADKLLRVQGKWDQAASKYLS